MTLKKNFRKIIIYSHICLKFSELNTECVGSVLGVTITTSPSLLNPKPCLSSQMKQFSKPWNKNKKTKKQKKKALQLLARKESKVRKNHIKSLLHFKN